MGIPQIACLLFSVVSFTLFANTLKVTDQRPLALADELTFSSDILETPPNIHVYLPADYHQSADHVRYPLILTLDGWALSQSVAGVVHHLGNTASMPKAVVVAIDSDDDYGWGPEIYPAQSGWKAPQDKLLKGFSRGGADLHLQFLEKELLPFIDKHYRTNEFRIIIGMSPSAAFALHTFWKAPDLFDAHFVFAATDVIGMGYTPDSTFIDKMAQSLAHSPNRKGYLYVASAQKEADKNPARAVNVDALIKALSPYTNKNFRLRVEHIPDFGHYPMALPGLLNALDLVFPRKDFDMSGKFSSFLAQDEPFEVITQYYETLSEQVGFTILPNADLRRNASCLRVAGYRLRNQKKFDDAEKVYHLWQEISPASVKAAYGLAALYQAKEENSEAITHFKQAKKLAEEQSSPLLSHINEQLSALEK